ncbi:MAG TPA: hypothetical protein VKZ59_14385, partial [Acidobacteriota bacterium]|nr:hypothetical protein [Acidobacteriota bacterium]
LSTLKRLLTLPREKAAWKEWSKNSFQISDYIPAGYLGPPNDLGQLRSYIVGWKLAPHERWLGAKTRFKQIDYPKLFTEFKATNPNAYGNENPINFFSASLSPDSLEGPWLRDIQQIVWLKTSENRGEALILESADGDIAYLPIQDLIWNKDKMRIRPDSHRDPLGYLQVVEPLEWLSAREWARRTGELEFSVTPIILTDLFRKNSQKRLEKLRSQSVSSEVQRLTLQALQVRFDQDIPDFRVWMNRGWNVNSKSHTPGGTHGGFNPIETRTTFLMWAGRDLPLKRGQKIPGPFFTYDIVPTLLKAVGITPSPSYQLPGDVVPFFEDLLVQKKAPGIESVLIAID